MTRVHIKLFGMKFEGHTTPVFAITLFAIAVFAVLPLMIYVSFLITHWAVFTLFAYNITGWQFIAACLLLSFISSFFKRANA